MSTTRNIIPHFRTISGMDSTTPPWLLPENKWVSSSGFRSYYGLVQQIKNLVSVSAGFNPGPQIHKIIPIPTGYRTEVHLVLLTTNGAYRVSYLGGNPILLGPAGGYEADEVDRIAATLYNNHIWFTSPRAPLMWTDGTKVESYTTDVPRARYLDNFFDHLVVANYTYKGIAAPWSFRFSDLYRPDIWDPTETNECDYYDVVSWQRDYSVVAGITGAGKIGDTFFLYTDSCIVGVGYVGLPKVFQVRPAWQDYGNAFLNGLVVAKDAHFFFDGYHQNFYAFDGVNRPQPIGDPILGFFLPKVNLSYISTDRTQELIGFTLPERNEAWWTFIGNDGNVYGIIYNWKANEWTHIHLPMLIYGTGGGGTFAKTVAELGATQVSALTGLAHQLSITDVQVYRQFSNISARYRQELPSDPIANSIGEELPTLETRDYFDDLQRVVEVDRLCIHANYEASAGVKVYVAVRDGLQEAVVFKHVGTWTKETRQGLITFKPIAGRIFRYKFEFQPTSPTTFPRGCEFYNFTDNIFNIKAEQ